MPGLCGDTPAMSFHWQDDLGLYESTFHSQASNEISHRSKKEAVIVSQRVKAPRTHTKRTSAARVLQSI